MAANQECEQHQGRQVVLFCIKCIRHLCAACVVGFKCPATLSQHHEFMEVDSVPVCLRNQLDIIQQQLSSEQSALQKHANCFASEEESKDVDFNSQVERVLQSRDEASQVLQQLQAAILAAATSATVSVLRAGIESDDKKQNVEDVHARAAACRQQSNTVARLRNLDDSSLLKEIAFVRNLIRCAAPTAASTPSPALAPVEPALGGQSAASVLHPHPTTHLAIASQMVKVVIQGKQLIQAFEKILEVCKYRLRLWIFTSKNSIASILK